MEKTINSSEYLLFIDLLRRARVAQKMSQTQLAGQLRSTQVFVSKCERGERRLDFVESMHWVEALGCSFPDFIAAYIDELQKLRYPEKTLRGGRKISKSEKN